VIKLLPAGTGALAAALMLTACTGSAHHAGRPSAAQCARAEADVRDTALLVAPVSGVTTSRGLAAAARKMGATGQVIMLATRARSSSGTVSFLSSGVMRATGTAPPLPPPLSREMRRVDADTNAFWAAVAAYSRSRAGPQAVGDAAQKAVRDIQAIRATCTRKHR
jgi:hypothetical protein